MGDASGPGASIDAWPTWGNLGLYLRADLRANGRDPKAQAVMLLFRLTQVIMGRRDSRRVRAWLLVIPYRVLTEWIFGQELRPKTVVGAGLAIHHGYGLVINDGVRIGTGVTLRNGVTIGHRRPGGGVPVLEDGVKVGANATILGGITIGKGAFIGAGTVVTEDVPPGTKVYAPRSVYSEGLPGATGSGWGET